VPDGMLHEEAVLMSGLWIMYQRICCICYALLPHPGVTEMVILFLERGYVFSLLREEVYHVQIFLKRMNFSRPMFSLKIPSFFTLSPSHQFLAACMEY
jgi:hypothetical protein